MQGFFILLRSEITLFYHKRNEKERTDTPAKIIKEAAKRPIRKAETRSHQAMMVTATPESTHTDADSKIIPKTIEMTLWSNWKKERFSLSRLK